MPTKVSEKKLFASVVLFISSFVLLFQVKLFDTPVRVSEKGLAFVIVSIVLMVVAVSLCKRAFTKV